MSNWELVMPGGGLTAIGMAGLVTSYAGIAHTFIDGMHALTGLLFFIGLIFLGAGILDGGVSTSNRTKATVLVIISIVLGFGGAAFIGNTSTTLPTITGLLIMITIPGIVIGYMSMKMPQYVKPVGFIFIFAVGLGITVFFGFGLLGPTDALVEQGYIIEWANDDEVTHTVTSSLDFGETFDSGLIDVGSTYQLDTTNLALGAYEYMCIVHPWMIATFVVEEPKGSVVEIINMPNGAGNNVEGQIFYDPQDVSVMKETVVLWNNNDEVAHTVTSSLDFGDTFDSGLIDAGGTFQIDTTGLETDTYEYFCIVHPWMIGSVTVE